MKRSTFSLFFFLFTLLVSAPVLQAEEAVGEDTIEIEIEDDDSITDTGNEGSRKPGKNIIESFLKNGKGKTKARYCWFFHPLEVLPDAGPQPDSQSHTLEQYSTYSSFFQEGIFRFDLSTSIATGNQKYTYTSRFTDMDKWDWQDWFQYSDNRRCYFDINECYMSLFFPVCDIIIGKKIFTNTLSPMYSPADNYKVIDTHDPFDPRESGRLQAEILFSTGDVTFTFLLWPYYQGGMEFGLLSRWGYYRAMYEIGQGNLNDAILTINERIFPPIAFENISYLGKVKATVPGWDFFISAFHGLAGNTVFKTVQIGTDTIEVSEVVPVFQAAFGFSTTFRNMEFHGEALYNYTYQLRDDHYIRYTGGIRSTFNGFTGFMERMEVSLEYAREDIFEKQNQPGYSRSTEERRILKNDILGLILFQFTPRLNLNLYGQYTIPDSGFIFLCDIDYRLVDNLELSLGTQFFIGPEGSGLYWWRDNNRLIAEITWNYL